MPFRLLRPQMFLRHLSPSKRRAGLALLLIAGVALGGPDALAQAPAPPYRVGLLSPGSPSSAAKALAAFMDELKARGHVEGQDLIVERRFAEGQPSRLKDLASELAQIPVNVFFAPTEPALLAAKASGRGIPIVTVTCDPMERMVGSLGRPGGNATGFSCVSASLAGKRLAYLKAVKPGLHVVGLLYSAQDAYEPDLRGVEAAARELGISIHRSPVSLPSDFEGAFRAMEDAHCQAVYIALSGFTNIHRKEFAQQALKRRLPSIFGFQEFAEDGGLMTYGADLSDGYRRAAYFVDRILRGASPVDLPAEEPTQFHLVINARTAGELGIKIPIEVLLQAERVIR